MDIVERLRKPVDDIFFGEVVEPIKWEAADEIERQRHALHLIATHPEIHLGVAEEMAAIAEHALQQKETK